ncbi:hypothetical protein [Pseudomonas fluorescens]
MSNLFCRSQNDFARKYLFKSVPVSKVDADNFHVAHQNLKSSLFENLMLFDKVSHKVYGENVPLTLMLTFMEVKQVEELIEQNALEFVLWTPFIAHWDSGISGLNPLVSGVQTESVYSDPEASLEAGLRFYTKPIKRRERRTLLRKARDCYKVPKPELSHSAVQLAQSAYRSSKLDVYGFNSMDVDLMELKKPQRELLGRCAEDLLQFSFLLESGMVSFGEKEFYSFFESSVAKLEQAYPIVKSYSELAKIENLPNFAEAFSRINDPFSNLIKLRGKGKSKRFRAWLAQVSADERLTDQIAAEYLNAVANAKGFFQTFKGKMVKNVAMTSIGMGVGTLIAGPLGTLVGPAAVKILEPVADVGLDLMDEFLISGLTKGWTPKMFIEDFRKLV